ncbi:MAG: sulfotransferase domain-containing protein, partial [Myxococcota bacterium]
DKELHFLCHYDYRGLSEEDVETYRAAFAAPPGKICGEFSGNILQHPMAIAYMAQAAPSAKIIALVRNPIDRTISAYNQFMSFRAPALVPENGPMRRIFENFSLFPEAMNASRLARPFREVLDHFPREQVLVLQYEACRADPVTAIRQTWDFLGLRQTGTPPGLRQRGHRIPYVIERPNPTQRQQMATWFQGDVDAFFGMFPELDRSLWEDFA